MQLSIEKRMVPHVPWGLIACVLAIAGLGIWNLASAARPPHATVWTSQTIYLGVSLFAGLMVCLVDYRWIQRMALPIYVANIVALLALRIFGHTAKGAESWFIIGPFRLQPAEFTDTIAQVQGQRGILEMRFPHLGPFMFHAHKTEFADLGWMGFFEVV